MKQQKGFVSMLILGIFAIIGLAVLVVPGIGGLILEAANGAPQHCSETPNDYRCFCDADEVKVGMFTFTCEPVPDIPATFSLPIETWEEAIAFSYSGMNGLQTCTGDLYFSNDVSGNLPTNPNGNFGAVIYDEFQNVIGYAEQVECMQRTSFVLGTQIWRVQFDPNDGYIYEVDCATCTGKKPFTPRTEPMEPICGDNKCSPGETFSLCPADCEEVPLCTGLSTKEQIEAYLDTYGKTWETANTLCVHQVGGAYLKRTSYSSGDKIGQTCFTYTGEQLMNFDSFSGYVKVNLIVSPRVCLMV